MIVDVLRNDLGRVCRPGHASASRASAGSSGRRAVQHLVSTVTGRLAAGRDAFDLLAASFPGGSITGAPEDPGDGDPRGASSRSAAARTPGRSAGSARTAPCRRASSSGRSWPTAAQLTLHVGGGITYRSDPAAEWEETVAKARGPLGAIGGVEVA